MLRQGIVSLAEHRFSSFMLLNSACLQFALVPGKSAGILCLRYQVPGISLQRESHLSSNLFVSCLWPCTCAQASVTFPRTWRRTLMSGTIGA